jgi:hypothetical protein
MSFTLHGLNLTPALLGIWQPEPALGLAFATPGQEIIETIVWSVSLPAETDQANFLLQAGFQRLHQGRRETLKAVTRLQQLPQPGPGEAETLAYSFDPAAQLPSPEDRLRHYLQQLQDGEAESLPYAYGIGGDLSIMVADYREFMSEMGRLLHPTLLTMTEIGGENIAITRINLTGNLETRWRLSCSPDQRELHRQAVSLSIESRIALLQLLGQISAGAAILAVKFSLGSSLLALPAVWRYLQDVSRQVQVFYDTVLIKAELASEGRG